MTARVVLSCDGQEGVYPCRQAVPVGAVLTGNEARRIAAGQGWSSRWSTAREHAHDYRLQDLCPACTRRDLESPR